MCSGDNTGIQAEGNQMEVTVGTLYPPNLKSSMLPFFLGTHLLGQLAVSNCVPATGQ